MPLVFAIFAYGLLLNVVQFPCHKCYAVDLIFFVANVLRDSILVKYVHIDIKHTFCSVPMQGLAENRRTLKNTAIK